MVRDFSNALKVSSVAEEYEITRKHKCECGGQLKFIHQSLLNNEDRYYDELQYVCVECNKQYEFLFDINSFFGSIF